MRTRPRGFTLIELLVVISIIALLVGILLPALGAAKKSAERIREINKLKQIGVATFAYCADNEDATPARPRASLWPHVMRQWKDRTSPAAKPFQYDLYKTFVEPYIGDELRDEIFFSKGPFLAEARTMDWVGYGKDDDPGYTTMQYHSFDRNTGNWLVDRIDLSRAGVDPQFNNSPLWSAVTWMSLSTKKFVAYDVSEDELEATGTTAVYGDGSASWVDFADMEPYWEASPYQFWQPLVRGRDRKQPVTP